MRKLSALLLAGSLGVLGMTTAASASAAAPSAPGGWMELPQTHVLMNARAVRAAPVVTPAAGFALILKADASVCAVTNGQGVPLSMGLYQDGNCGNFHNVAAGGGYTFIENANGHGVREQTNKVVELGNGSPQNSDPGAKWLIDSTGIYSPYTNDYIVGPCDCAGGQQVIARQPGAGGYRFQE